MNHILLEEIQDTLYLGEDLLAELMHACKHQGDTVSMDEEQESVEIVVICQMNNVYKKQYCETNVYGGCLSTVGRERV